jgi:hypothetical protein
MRNGMGGIVPALQLQMNAASIGGLAEKVRAWILHLR